MCFKDLINGKAVKNQEKKTITIDLTLHNEFHALLVSLLDNHMSSILLLASAQLFVHVIGHFSWISVSIDIISLKVR